MAKYAGAQYRPLGTQTEPVMTAHDIVCLHTMVGYLKSTDAMFKEDGYSGTESHFGVGGKWGSDASAGLDGVVYQWQDTKYAADANLDGWYRVISIETADNAPQYASDIEKWTPKQVKAIAQVVAWCCETYNIPAALVPDSKPGRRGIAYHRQGISPWRVSGGEVWSNANGKECPGDRRINQITAEIIPAVLDILNGEAPVVDETQNPEWTTPVAVMSYVDSLYDDPDGKMNRDQLLQHSAGQAKAANDTAGTALEKIANLQNQVTGLTNTVAAMQADIAKILANTTPPTA